MCFDKNSGRLLVDKEIYSGLPKIKRHTKSTHANATLATDGTRLIAMLGSEGLHAFDFDGNRLWTKDLGVLDSGFYMVPDAQWEFASSPVIHDGKVVIQADVQKGSFIAAFDVASGKELWRTARQEIPTFSTPAIHQVRGNAQVLVNGWKHIGAYDLATGKEVWKMQGLGDIPVPVPVVGHGLVFITNAHGAGAPIYAIRETATGDISLAAGESTNANIAWSTRGDGAYLISPLLYGDLLYVSKNNGVFTVFDAKTGDKLYTQRLGQRHHGIHRLHHRGGRQDLFHERGRRRLRRQSRPHVRAALRESARRNHHGDAGGFGGNTLLPHQRKDRRHQVITEASAKWQSEGRWRTPPRPNPSVRYASVQNPSRD